MRLDSVRELKAALSKRVVTPVAMAAPSALRFAVSAQPMEEVDSTFRTLAIGVAPRAKQQYRLAVRVQRRALLDGPHMDRIRKAARGEVDVRYVGRIVKRAATWEQRRRRPLRIGVSIGHFQITAGTLGCFASRKSDGAVLILSNNHVLANENDARQGDAILQPGKYDGGRNTADVVAELAKFVKLKARGANLVDAATALVRERIDYEPGTIKGLGRLTGTGDLPETNVRLAKFGRTTGLTRGRVTAFELDNVVVSYDLGNLSFDNQIEIEGAGADPFSDGGDSGSLIVDGDRRGVALLFAGGDQGGTNGRGLTYANPLAPVLSKLSINLLF